MAELLRLKGEILRWRGMSDLAENHFLQSLDWARRQGALSWELRAATSLAELHRAQGRNEDARTSVATVYWRFTEGFATTDMRAAKELIDKK
jgi:predicted ATPase